MDTNWPTPFRLPAAGAAQKAVMIGRVLRKWGLTTISLIFQESPVRFHARNPFAVGGVYEDPATGAAAAALVAYLHDLGITESENIEIVQGEDMGVPCLLHARAPSTRGGSAFVYGSVRDIDA